jgi:hypothetical protein
MLNILKTAFFMCAFSALCQTASGVTICDVTLATMGSPTTVSVQGALVPAIGGGRPAEPHVRDDRETRLPTTDW